MARTRKLLPTEGPLLADHLIRLEPEDRRLRFGGLFMPDDLVRRHAEAIDWVHAWHIGWFDAGVLRGIVHLSVPRRVIANGPPWMRAGAGEFGVSVEKPWRRQGVATLLIARAVALARNRQISDLYMVCQPENEPMRCLAKKIGIRLAYDEGEVIGNLRLPAPDRLSAQAELAIEAANVIGRWATLEVPPAAS